VGKGVDSPENHTAQEGALVIWIDTSGETSAGTYKLELAIEKSCRNVLAHTPKGCKGIPSDQWVPSYQGQ
jgi:hypothetical protein